MGALPRSLAGTRRGLPRGKQAAAASKPAEHKPELLPTLPPFVFRKSEFAA
jgi:hypothetical protein